jgi:flagellar hook-associated protein 3 FlgL
VSTVFRVTQSTLTRAAHSNLQTSLSRLQTLEEQLSSGRSISKPSDSPSQATAALSFQADIRRSTQLLRNAEDAKGWLGTADTTLLSGLDVLHRARELLQSGVNGAMDAAGRGALADEVDQLREQMLSLANTTYLGRPIFAGTSSSPAAYDASGTYLGDAGTVDRSVTSNVSVTVNTTGPQAFGPPGADVFTVLAAIASDLRSNPGNLGADQAALDSAFGRMNDALAVVGAKYNHVEAMAAKVDASILDSTNGLAEVSSIDLPATIVQLQMQQVAYQAALSATAKAIQPSLVDFLR